jgi:hypothetical protein
LENPVLYKEYIGYKHFDKHLQLDLPFGYHWMRGISRNPFQKNISWETDDLNNNGCDWLRILNFDTTLAPASWHSQLNTGYYNKRDKIYVDVPYYDLNKSAAFKASYNNNVFDIQTSRITEIELLLSPVMANLQNAIVIKVNGREIFHDRVAADKAFLLKNFSSTFDRKAIWVTSLKVKTD